VTNIEGILKQSDSMLGKLFIGHGFDSGAEVRKFILKLKKKGDIYIGSDNCKHFDPIDGCLCRYYGEDSQPLKIRHIGNVKTLCGEGLNSGLRSDLGYKTYEQLGVKERLKGETPYRICEKCLEIIKKKEAGIN